MYKSLIAMTHLERLVHAWLLGPHIDQWLDLDPRTRLPIEPGLFNNEPSTMIGLNARQGLLARQHRAHRSTGGRGRAATAQQQQEHQYPQEEQAQCSACRSLHEHTPRIELRQHAADGKPYYHVHGLVGFPLVLPASDLSPMEDPMRAGEILLPVAHDTSERLQALSYEYTLEAAANSKKQEKDAATCSICLDGLGTKVRVLACKHQFHPACIDNWCRQQKDDKTCPYCRQVLWG